jgi:hypothetical protein
MKPPENTLSNNEYNNLQREGLKKLIEVEKNRSDQQSMLRWTMGGANDNRKSRAEAEEQMTEVEEKRVTLRKRQKELQERKYHGQKASQPKELIHSLHAPKTVRRTMQIEKAKQNKKRKGRREPSRQKWSMQ